MNVVSISLSPTMSLAACRWEGGGKTPAICLHGLTRNLKDFEDFAPWLASTGRDVVALSLRGRGESSYDPDYRNYHPLVYRDDVLAAMDRLEVERAVVVGTSLGGIVAMLMNTAAPGRIAGVILNDIGPDLAPEGIARIAGYAGGVRGDAATFDDAVQQIRAINEVAFPGRNDAFWRVFAERTYRPSDGGRWRLDYDQNIGRALLEAGPAPDLWPPFRTLNGKPVLSVRGAISDLLSPAIVAKMREAVPNLVACDVAATGHAPALTEPDAIATIREFLREFEL
jgi:pimeloyl-ACP methyl ester carboxylesterase